MLIMQDKYPRRARRPAGFLPKAGAGITRLARVYAQNAHTRMKARKLVTSMWGDK